MGRKFAIALALAAVLLSGIAPQAAAKKKAPAGYDVYLLIGQSNMAGRGKLLPKDFKEKFKDIYLLNEEGVPVLASQPFNQYSSIRKDMKMQQMNPGYGFAKKMRKYNKKRPILLVCNPRGGTSILEWAPGKNYFTEAVRRCKQGMAYGELKGILWHQGCADSRQRCDVYPDLLSEMVDSLRSELGVGDKVPFIVGELAHWRKTSAAFNEMLHGIPDRIPNSGWVSAEGCTPLKDEKDPHFSRDGQILLGTRYAEKMHEMQK